MTSSSSPTPPAFFRPADRDLLYYLLAELGALTHSHEEDGHARLSDHSAQAAGHPASLASAFEELGPCFI